MWYHWVMYKFWMFLSDAAWKYDKPGLDTEFEYYASEHWETGWEIKEGC